MSQLTFFSTKISTKKVSCDFVGETSAWFKQQRWQRSTQCVVKTLPIHCYHLKNIIMKL